MVFDALIVLILLVPAIPLSLLLFLLMNHGFDPYSDSRNEISRVRRRRRQKELVTGVAHSTRAVIGTLMPSDLQYRLVGTPSGHLWRSFERVGDIEEYECTYCGTHMKERHVNGTVTAWTELVTPFVPRCSHRFESR